MTQPPPEGPPPAASRHLLRAFLVQVLDDAVDENQAKSKADKIRLALAESLRPMRAARSSEPQFERPDELGALAVQSSTLSLHLATRDPEGKVHLDGAVAEELREVLDIDLVRLIEAVLQQRMLATSQDARTCFGAGTDLGEAVATSVEQSGPVKVRSTMTATGGATEIVRGNDFLHLAEQGFREIMGKPTAIVRPVRVCSESTAREYLFECFKPEALAAMPWPIRAVLGITAEGQPVAPVPLLEMLGASPTWANILDPILRQAASGTAEEPSPRSWYYAIGGYEGEPDYSGPALLSRAQARTRWSANYDVQGPFDSLDAAQADLDAWLKSNDDADEEPAPSARATAVQPAWLQPQNFHTLLAMVSVDLPLELIEAMPTDRRDAARVWAAATHARASDNDVEVPPMPAFLAPFFRVSPGLPLGWKNGDPRPPEEIDTCSDTHLLRACAVAALRRAELAPPSGGGVLWIATLKDIAHALEHSDLDVIDFVAIRTNLLRLFTANAPAPAALHLHEADHLIWRLEEIVNAHAPIENMVPDALRIAAAMYLRRTYYPQEEISGIWAGCGSVFPDFNEPGAWSIHEMHQRLAADLAADLALELPALVSMGAGLDALRPVLDEARHHVVTSLRLAQVALRHLHRRLSTT